MTHIARFKEAPKRCLDLWTLWYGWPLTTKSTVQLEAAGVTCSAAVSNTRTLSPTTFSLRWGWLLRILSFQHAVISADVVGIQHTSTMTWIWKIRSSHPLNTMILSLNVNRRSNASAFQSQIISWPAAVHLFCSCHLLAMNLVTLQNVSESLTISCVQGILQQTASATTWSQGRKREGRETGYVSLALTRPFFNIHHFTYSLPSPFHSRMHQNTGGCISAQRHIYLAFSFHLPQKNGEHCRIKRESLWPWKSSRLAIQTALIKACVYKELSSCPQ